MSAIEEAKNLGEVVEIINLSADGGTPTYFGGSDLREPEDMAAEYAYAAAEESGDLTGDSIEAHLELLTEAGAKFDLFDALQKAIQLKKN